MQHSCLLQWSSCLTSLAALHRHIADWVEGSHLHPAVQAA